MDTAYSTFKPRYPYHIFLVFYGLPALFFALLCGGVNYLFQAPLLFWFLAFLLGLVTSLAPFFVIREIRFLEQMVIRRHFLPDLFFTYKELQAIMPTFILAGGHRIRMGRIENLEELRTMAQRWTSARILKESRKLVKPGEPLFPQRGYSTYATIWGLLLGVIGMFLAPAWLPVDPRWVLGGIFLLAYVLYVYFIPRIL
jgi:hypothetical protein